MENSRAKPPPGVEEALQSMLWTPYPETSSESSSDESDLESFKRRKRPLTWAVNDNHDFSSRADPYSISSRLSYPSYYPPSYQTPKLLSHSFTDHFLASTTGYQQVEQDHRTPITDNGINYQIHQQQSGFISFYNNNNNNTSNVAATPSLNNSFHFSSFIGNGSVVSTTIDRNQSINKENELYCRSNVTRHEPVCHDEVGGIVGEVDSGSLCATIQNTIQSNEFSCVEVVDENGSVEKNNVVAHTDYCYSVIQQQQKKLNKFIVESTLGGMRLNVPCPDVNMTIIGDTSVNNNNCNNVYVSSSSVTATTTTVSSSVHQLPSNRNNSGQGSLTIPVNQQTSSVNIVNCYRIVPNNNDDENNIIIKEEENCQSNSSSSNKNDNKCDIIEVDSNNEKSSKNIKLSSNIISIESSDNERVSSDTSKLEQSIYISSSDQTNIDAISSVQNDPSPETNASSSSREQRRRERRERRAARNRMAHIHALHGSNQITASAQMHRPTGPTFEIIPDLLHSHLPPPYTTLPLQPSAATTTTIIATPVPVPVSAVDNCRYSFPLPIIRRSPSERSGKGCCGQWFAFAGPPLRALIAVVALGGVACALGGAALGATSLAGPPQSHFTAALLMIGVGVILVTISGAAWKMTAPGGPPCLGLGTSADLGRCNRRACARAGTNGHVIYPEFQHRPPPPSYQASMQEYRLRLLLLDRDRQSSVLRVASPPPTYRSTSGSLLRTTTTATRPNQSGHQSAGIFSGITEIISGLSHNINNTNQNNIESISNNSSEATLPPSYRTRNIRNGQTGSHLRPISAYNNNNNDPNPDFTLAIRSSSMENISTVHRRQHQQPKNVNSSKCMTTTTSINSSSTNQNQIDRESISDSSNNNTNNNKNNNDLVTIVTISGFIDENENRKSGDETMTEEVTTVLAHL